MLEHTIVGLWRPAFFVGIGNRQLTAADDQHLMGSARQVTQLGWAVSEESTARS